MSSLFSDSDFFDFALYSTAGTSAVSEGSDDMSFESFELHFDIQLSLPMYTLSGRDSFQHVEPCIDTALVFGSQAPSSSDTDSEPDTSERRRSIRLTGKTPKVLLDNKHTDGSKRSRKGKRTVSAAGMIKNANAPARRSISTQNSKPRGRSLRNVAASEARRKAEAKYECPFEDCSARYTARHHFKSHINKHNGVGLKHCPHCTYSTFYSDLPRHVRLRH